jgi:hypothetical protein
MFSESKAPPWKKLPIQIAKNAFIHSYAMPKHILAAVVSSNSPASHEQLIAAGPGQLVKLQVAC